MTEPRITYYTEDLIDSRKAYAIPGTFPREYAIIEFEPEPEEIENLVPNFEPTIKHCARCKRVIKPRYTYCYRCTNYIRVKQRIENALQNLEIERTKQHEH